MSHLHSTRPVGRATPHLARLPGTTSSHLSLRSVLLLCSRPPRSDLLSDDQPLCLRPPPSPSPRQLLHLLGGPAQGPLLECAMSGLSCELPVSSSAL